MLVSALSVSCHDKNEKKATNSASPKLKEETVTYKVDSLTMNSFVVYDENIIGKRPGILVVHEWWGLNDYVKRRARELAGLGYVAMAVDMYGNGRMGNDVQEASQLSAPFYKDPAMSKRVFDAAVEKLKSMDVTDTAKLGAMGYCFGGGIVLNVARMGEPLKAVVSFHGSLMGVPASKDLLHAAILVCHGDSDKFVLPAEVAAFKKQMDSVEAEYKFVSYPGATHAFTNPDATALGQKFQIPIAYNAAADTASWNEMKTFFERILK
jgi:dienelactone hydrolase